MNSNQDYIYSLKTIESIIANPDSSWKTVFKEMIISMIASNTNELLWYANFLSRCEYEFHFDESFVSSVYFNGKNFVIVVNPVILGVIHKDQIIAILKHSAGHIINHHFARGNYDNSINKEVIETAKDIVINGCKKVPYIKDLPRTGSYKDSPIAALFYQSLFQKYRIESYEVGREFEYYVELIQEALKEGSFEEAQDDESSAADLENSSDDEIGIPSDSSQDKNETSNPSSNGEEDGSQDEDQNSGSSNNNDETNIQSESLSDKTIEALNNGDCKMDNHEYGERLQEAVGLENNVLNSFMDSTLNEMIHDSTDFARGFTPGLVTGVLSKIEKKNSHKNWKKILNKNMQNSLNKSMRYREPNKSRQHPIFQDDLDLYGYSPTKKPKLAVVLDVSGSVDDKLLSSLMSEVQAIQRKYSIKSLTLVQVDAEIKDIQKFGVRDKFIKRQGSGGTIMEPGFKALLEQSNREIPDMIICATDGDIEKSFKEVKIPNKVQVIWLVEEKGRLLFDVSQYPKQQMHVIKFSV
ncbi:MAG: putative metal-dependent peptidase [Sulfurimonas sp.]|jgi:predicted metal-dependent peptidase|uniref:VWA-like domain-containing protein n=1 Tax=Sulfurimonas sp. TaxID=2022749 RepID=UPI0039E28D50